MKVHGPSSSPPVEVVQPKRRASQAERTSQLPAEKIGVSDVAKAVAAGRAPEAPDAKLVERLRDAIDRGVFKVDPEKIAEVMLREEK